MLRLGKKTDRGGGGKPTMSPQAPPSLHMEEQVHFPSDIMAGAYPRS